MHRLYSSLWITLVALTPLCTHAQARFEPGHSIGNVSTRDQLVVLELDEGMLGHANLFDLAGRTLRFTPEKGGYRVENLALVWDAEFGPQHSGGDVKLQNFSFPFSGKSWDSFSVGVTGSIRFGPPQSRPAFEVDQPPAQTRMGGITIARFDQLAVAARNLVNTVPAICVFFKPRTSGPHYVKELADRVVITWDVTEPYGSIQDFTWVKTTNRFQAVLRRDGSIDMSYRDVAAKDAIVGVYPIPSATAERRLASLAVAKHSGVAANLDFKNLSVSVADSLLLKVTLEMRGPVSPENGAEITGIAYRISFSSQQVRGTQNVPKPDLTWTVRRFSPPERTGGAPRYVAFGNGAMGVKASGNFLSIQGTLPPALARATRVSVWAEAIPAASSVPVASTRAVIVRLAGVRSPEVHFSAVRHQDGPFPVVYESFHYPALPNPRDLTCTVIKALGDKFDFLAYYSDFRIDNQEAGTPSNGPLGGGPAGGAVTGIGATQRGLESYCTAGRFQWQFIQPVYVGSNQMQERPPDDSPLGTQRDITYYARQLAERSSDHKMTGYNYAMSQLGHEMGHRWAAFVSAKIGDKTIPLGPTHWARGLQAPAAFPYQRPYEASAMGGGVWQDNFDGTFTQLDDDYYVPATGWSYLDLYLMGFISAAEVPDFFILRNLLPVGRDANGHQIFKAERTKVRIEDVIAVEGPRLPDPEHSQRAFNTGIVLVVEHGAQPSPELIQRANGIRQTWIDYWATTTGHRATMTTQP